MHIAHCAIQSIDRRRSNIYSKKFIESRNFFHFFLQPHSHTHHTHNHSISENLFDLACRRRPTISNVTIVDLIHFDQISFYSGIQVCEHSRIVFVCLSISVCVWLVVVILIRTKLMITSFIKCTPKIIPINYQLNRLHQIELCGCKHLLNGDFPNQFQFSSIAFIFLR